MRLVFLSGGDPEDLSQWSGTPYFVYRELKRHFGDVPALWWPFGAGVSRGLRKLLSPLRMDAAREPAVGQAFYWYLRRRLRQLKPDAVFSLAYSAETFKIAEEFPVIHCADSTFQAMVDYYPGYFSRLAGRTLEKG